MVDDAGGLAGKNSRNSGVQDTKKIDNYFTKQQGASPVRHGGGGAKSPSSATPATYPMVRTQNRRLSVCLFISHSCRVEQLKKGDEKKAPR